MNDEPGSSSLHIAVSVHDAAWLDAVGDLKDRARSAVRTALEHACGAGSPGGGRALEVSLVFTDDAEQRALNRDYRHQDRTTNVLSFPNMDDVADEAAAGQPQLLGDVVLARETVAREAVAQGKPLADHTTHLVVHGLLHLLGHDHQQPAEAVEMESLETRILAALGIADPYAAGEGERRAATPLPAAPGGARHG